MKPYSKRPCICKNCNKVFNAGYDAKFCSRDCSGAYRKKSTIHIKKVCFQCRKSFHRTYYGKTEKLFCSRKCFAEYRKEKSIIYVICPVCGEVFSRASYNIKKESSQLYCSRKCAVIGKNKARKSFYPTKEHRRAAEYFRLRIHEIKELDCMGLLDSKIELLKLKKELRNERKGN